MVRYKRYRRNGRRGRSTNIIKMKFQSFMDISTSDQSMQIITISAGGKEILRRLAPQFGAYKYYKIGNISVKLVPASTLPVDPTGLSYEVGENPTVDPRDQLTPGMMRITNGEDVFEDISGLSDTAQHQIYNNMLLDNRWFKWMLQSGVKRHATPRYWQIGQLHQDKWPGAIMNYPQMLSLSEGGVALRDTMHKEVSRNYIEGTDNVRNLPGSSPYGLFQTGHKGVLGWLPTDGLQPIATSSDSGREQPLLASPPEVEVMKIILPKAYKTRYYYRAFITETVYFREPIVNFGIVNHVTGVGVDYYSSYRPIDVFHIPGVPSPRLPTESDPNVSFPNDDNSGGNYGDN